MNISNSTNEEYLDLNNKQIEVIEETLNKNLLKNKFNKIILNKIQPIKTKNIIIILTTYSILSSLILYLITNKNEEILIKNNLLDKEVAKYKYIILLIDFLCNMALLMIPNLLDKIFNYLFIEEKNLRWFLGSTSLKNSEKIIIIFILLFEGIFIYYIRKFIYKSCKDKVFDYILKNYRATLISQESIKDMNTYYSIFQFFYAIFPTCLIKNYFYLKAKNYNYVKDTLSKNYKNQKLIKNKEMEVIYKEYLL